MSELEQKARQAAERWFKDEWAALAKATDDQKEGESIHSWAADIERREDALACHIADTFAATAVGDAEGVDVFQREPADFCELAGDCKRCIQPGNCTCTHHAPTDQCHEFIPAQRCYLSAGHEGVHFSEDVVPDGRVAEGAQRIAELDVKRLARHAAGKVEPYLDYDKVGMATCADGKTPEQFVAAIVADVFKSAAVPAQQIIDEAGKVGQLMNAAQASGYRAAVGACIEKVRDHFPLWSDIKVHASECATQESSECSCDCAPDSIEGFIDYLQSFLREV